jgi:hypothetical protein
MVIRVVVEAHDVATAVDSAQSYFRERLSIHEGNGPFDYCTPMVEGKTVSGADRWTDYQNKQSAFPVDSDPGRAEIHDAWQSTKSEIESDIEDVWDSMQACDTVHEFTENVLDDEMLAYRLGKMGSNSVNEFLFVQGWSGSGITSYRGWDHVQEIIEQEEADDDTTMWVVPLDAHY